VARQETEEDGSRRWQLRCRVRSNARSLRLVLQRLPQGPLNPARKPPDLTDVDYHRSSGKNTIRRRAEASPPPSLHPSGLPLPCSSGGEGRNGGGRGLAAAPPELPVREEWQHKLGGLWR